MLEPILTDRKKKGGLFLMKTISALMLQTPFGFASRRLQASSPNARRTCRLRIRASLLENLLIHINLGIEDTLPDGKRQKLTCKKVVDAGSAEVNGSGNAAAEIKVAAYGKRNSA